MHQQKFPLGIYTHINTHTQTHTHIHISLQLIIDRQFDSIAIFVKEEGKQWITPGTHVPARVRDCYLKEGKMCYWLHQLMKPHKVLWWLLTVFTSPDQFWLLIWANVFTLESKWLFSARILFLLLPRGCFHVHHSEYLKNFQRFFLSRIQNVCKQTCQ